jgi:hypothetical protein
MSDISAFVERCATTDDADTFLDMLRSVPHHDWPSIHARLLERLDNTVTGEPTPPLTAGEARRQELLSAHDPAHARTLAGKRAILATEDQQRRARVSR